METKNVEITDVTLSMSGGYLRFYVFLEGNGFKGNYGGYVIGHGFLGSKEFSAENGYGLVAMMNIMNVVGVENWEDLKGKYCRVKIENGCGDTVKAIGHIINDQWFDMREFFKKCKEGITYAQ